jgi:hypothetical protein
MLCTDSKGVAGDQPAQVGVGRWLPGVAVILLARRRAARGDDPEVQVVRYPGVGAGGIRPGEGGPEQPGVRRQVEPVPRPPSLSNGVVVAHVERYRRGWGQGRRRFTRPQPKPWLRLAAVIGSVGMFGSEVLSMLVAPLTSVARSSAELGPS